MSGNSEKKLSNCTYIAFDKRRKRIMRQASAQGAPKYTLRTRPFLLKDMVTLFYSQASKTRPKRYSTAKQMEFYKKVYNKPFFAPYVYCISSEPNDSYAMSVGVFLMIRAIEVKRKEEQLDEKQREMLAGKSLPIWHTIVGGFGDPLLNKNKNPSMLILSNVPGGRQSTQHKMEKLRDILEVYSHIPRIVLTTNTDPVTMFEDELHYPINYATYLTTNLREEEV